MRTVWIALLVCAAALAPAQQPAAVDPVFPGKLLIPAQLTQTVRADKAHPGDAIELRTLEAVLVEKDLVMPADTHLVGRVLGAAPRQDNKNSWLLVVVERADWKDHSLSLRAFIAAQITVAGPKNQRLADPSNDVPAQNRRTARQSARTGVMTDPSLSSMVRTPQDANETVQEESGSKHPWLENVGILRDKDGTTYLLSSKSNVKLPAGVLLMLRNEPVANPATAESRTASPSSAQP